MGLLPMGTTSRLKLSPLPFVELHHGHVCVSLCATFMCRTDGHRNHPHGPTSSLRTCLVIGTDPGHQTHPACLTQVLGPEVLAPLAFGHAGHPVPLPLGAAGPRCSLTFTLLPVVVGVTILLACKHRGSAATRIFFDTHSTQLSMQLCLKII